LPDVGDSLLVTDCSYVFVMVHECL